MANEHRNSPTPVRVSAPQTFPAETSFEEIPTLGVVNVGSDAQIFRAMSKKKKNTPHASGRCYPERRGRLCPGRRSCGAEGRGAAGLVFSRSWLVKFKASDLAVLCGYWCCPGVGASWAQNAEQVVPRANGLIQLWSKTKSPHINRISTTRVVICYVANTCRSSERRRPTMRHRRYASRRTDGHRDRTVRFRLLLGRLVRQWPYRHEA